MNEKGGRAVSANRHHGALYTESWGIWASGKFVCSVPARNTPNTLANREPEMKSLVLAALLLTASCAQMHDETFTGTVTPLAGVCDAPTRAILTIRHSTVQFTPSGVLNLSGAIDPSGHISASLSLSGADRKGYKLSFAGERHGDVITGIYATPRCRASVTLRRAG